jgi:hypothetical protein
VSNQSSSFFGANMKVISYFEMFAGCQGGATTLSITTFTLTTLSITTLSIMTFSITTLSITTLSIMTFSITTLSITTFSIMTFSITTFNITGLSAALSINDHEHSSALTA